MNQFIYIIDTNKHLNILNRISGVFSKRRVIISSLQATIQENSQRIVIGITETTEIAKKISKQLKKQVDVISVNLFEQTM